MGWNRTGGFKNKRETNIGMDVDVLTLGFARRAATYKRGDLLFTDIERIFQVKEALKDKIKIAYLENYDTELGKMITSGVDIWLNTSQPPNEASGTSGMKAALNGVPSLSVLDGWWVEGCIEGVIGWSIGERGDHYDPSKDATSLGGISIENNQAYHLQCWCASFPTRKAP